MRLRRALLPTIATAACIALAAVGCGDTEPDESSAPAAVTEQTAESDARAGAGDDALVDGAAQSSSDAAFAEGGSCFTQWSPPIAVPDGVTLEGWANVSFKNAEEEPVVTAALAAETGVDAAKIECFFAEDGEPEPALEGAPGSPEEAADAAASVAPDAGVSDEPVGYGWCGTEWEPDLAAGTLPDGTVMNLNLGANFGPKSLLEPARATIAEASARPADTIECNHEIPPIGECSVQLGPGGEGLPEGARVEGNVFGSYIRKADKARIKTAVATLAGVDPSEVRCMDFDEEPFEGEGDERIPVEPDGGPGSSGDGDAAISGPAPE